MKPVNLLPEESRSGGGPTGDPLMAWGFVAILSLAFLMTFYAISISNKATTAQDEANALRAQVTRYQVKAEPVQKFNDFSSEVDKRTLLIAGLSERRFPWHTALFNLSQSTPQDVTLDTIKAESLDPNSSAQASTDPNSQPEEQPGASLELTGCSKDWIPLTRFASRLEAMPGVLRVNIASSGDDEGGSDSGSGGAGDDDAARHKNCGATPVKFTLKVGYRQIPLDLVGLPKLASATGASGATGATPPGQTPEGTPAASEAP